jgi:small subunit ribosomal protein S3
VIKMRAESAMSAGAKGCKIQISGRLGGAEMSRTLAVRLGSLPLSTFQANIDYGVAEAFTTYGAIGCKVWIFKGMYAQGQEEEQQSNAAGARARARGRR